MRKTEILFVGVGSSFSLPLLVLQVDRYWPLNNFNRTCHLFLKDLSCAALVNLYYDFFTKKPSKAFNIFIESLTLLLSPFVRQKIISFRHQGCFLNKRI